MLHRAQRLAGPDRRGAAALLCGLLAACGASASGGGGAGGGGGGQTDPLASSRAACVAPINAYRAQVGVPAQASWPGAASCADGQTASDAASGTAHGAFGRCGEHAQNECLGFSGLDQIAGLCLEMLFDEGPPGSGPGEHGRYVNMTSTAYGQVACGFAQDSHGEWWSVQDFQ